MTPVTSWRDGLLALADGSVFEGEVLGFDLNGSSPPAGPAGGEVVFNTVMTGYQEVLTDPSYAGQTIVFTYPHIGNYGVAPADDESRRPFCRGLIVRELTARPSNWRAVEPLAGFLSRHGLKAMAGADTRRLTRQIRDAGAMPGVFGPVDGRPGSFDEAALLAAARVEPPTDGRDLVAEVTCSSPYRYGEGAFEVVAYDFGIKRNILRNLAEVASVTVVPASTPAAEVLDRRPDGVFLSNGPGDPAAVAGATETVACSERCPCSAYVSGTRSWPRPSGPRRTSCLSGTTEGTTPSGAWLRAPWRSRAKTTTMPSSRARSRHQWRPATST